MRASQISAAALKAVELNTFHASSHFLLGACQADQRKNVQSLLAMYFFLFLEPDTKRSIGALEISGAMERQGVERTSEKEINISLNLSEPNDPFGATSLILSLLNTGIESVDGDVKSAEQQFYDKTNSMFSTLKESREGNDGIWWDLYVDFYSQLQEHGHLEAFCYYIKQSNDGATVDWLNENEEKVNQMFTWTNEVYFKK